MVERDLSLAALRAPAAPPHAPLRQGVGRAPLRAARRLAGCDASAEVTPHHLVLTDEAVRSLDPNVKMNPPLRARRRPQVADRGASRRHDRARRHRPRTALARREGGAVRGGAVRRHRARDRVRGALHAPRRAGCSSRSETLLERMSAGPARALRTRRAARIEVGARAPTSSCSTSRRSGRSTRGGFRSRSANSWLLGETPARCGREDDRRRTRGARMSAFLALEDGTVFRGESVGARRRRVRRGGLHDRDDRLPGDRHRPELRRAARLLHRADGRQLRRRRRRGPSRPARTPSAVADARGARARTGRTGSTERGIVALTGHRHALARPHAARGGRDALRPPSPGRSPREALDAGREQPSMAGAALVARRLDARSRTCTATPGTVRVAVVDYGCKRSILRRLAGAGAAVTVFPHDVDADDAGRLRRRAALERPRRP